MSPLLVHLTTLQLDFPAAELLPHVSQERRAYNWLPAFVFTPSPWRRWTAVSNLRWLSVPFIEQKPAAADHSLSSLVNATAAASLRERELLPQDVWPTHFEPFQDCQKGAGLQVEKELLKRTACHYTCSFLKSHVREKRWLVIGAGTRTERLKLGKLPEQSSFAQRWLQLSHICFVTHQLGTVGL